MVTDFFLLSVVPLIFLMDTVLEKMGYLPILPVNIIFVPVMITESLGVNRLLFILYDSHCIYKLHKYLVTLLFMGVFAFYDCKNGSMSNGLHKYTLTGKVLLLPYSVNGS